MSIFLLLTLSLIKYAHTDVELINHSFDKPYGGNDSCISCSGLNISLIFIFSDTLRYSFLACYW